MKVECRWRPIRFSQYDRGQIEVVAGFALGSIFRNRNTGQVRFYSVDDMDDKVVMVNGGNVLFRSRGRFGLLYIGQ